MMAYERTHIIFITLITFVLVILVWSSATRINDYKDYHYSLAANTVNNVSESIGSFIKERKRLIQVFADKHKNLIKQSALNPFNEATKAKLEAVIKKYFPEYFSFTITNTHGIPYYDDFDGMIGDLCLADIKSFIDAKKASPRVHPHHEVYHYDLLANVNLERERFIFFISFPADEISTYLKSAQSIGHQTILTIKALDNIIEVTTSGARNKKFREDYRLTQTELNYVLDEKNIKGTSWTVNDFQESNLFSKFRKKIIYETGFIFIVFLIVSGILFLLLKNEEKKRKKAEAVKSEFVTIVSHELRTPLTSIGGAIKLIENEVLGPVNKDIKKYLSMASSNIDRLTGLVNDILDVKKMESGEFKLQKENINIVNLVEQAVSENTDYAKKFNANFEFDKPAKDYIVNGDKGRLLQVMANLLSNAVKYGAKEDCIKIYFNELSKNIQINIEDHGKGIDENNKEKLFEKFTQAHSRENEVVKGTGLGLNISKTIIENHDGMISCKTGKDKATIFYIILPLVV